MVTNLLSSGVSLPLRICAKKQAQKNHLEKFKGGFVVFA